MNFHLRHRIRAAATRLRHPLFLPRPEVHRGRFGGVLLVPSAGYHVAELWPLAQELRTRGYQVTFLTPRVAPHQVLGALHAVSPEEPLFSWPRWFDLVPPFRAVVVMNDWGPTRHLVELAQRRAAPSFGKVEGVQDFNDVDTGRVRHPYRWVDHVLAQGENDADALAGTSATVVGSSRLERLWAGPERNGWSVTDPVVVVNCNFTFGVLQSERRTWLDAVLDACAGVARPLICQHPAEQRLPASYPVTTTPMCELLHHTADVLVSRFSTVPFEAMALGVPFVYHRPASETVATFAHPEGAFAHVEAPDELPAAIRTALGWRGIYRRLASSFFLRQIDVAAESSEVRAADAIEARIDSCS